VVLDSIPGIAATTAALLLAEVPDIKRYHSARQVAAFAGLVPREREPQEKRRVNYIAHGDVGDRDSSRNPPSTLSSANPLE
jgi:transposase